MVTASPYIVDEVAEKMKSAYSYFSDGKRKEYEAGLHDTLEKLEEVIRKYPNDEEIKKYYDSFAAFYEKKTREEEKKRLTDFISDIEHMVYWRKIAMASGKELPYKDYRHLRGGKSGR